METDFFQIKLDNIDIRDLNVKWLRRQIGVVSQEPVLFGCTIAENIKYGRNDVTDQEVMQAIEDANAKVFMNKLPKVTTGTLTISLLGFNTQI